MNESALKVSETRVPQQVSERVKRAVEALKQDETATVEQVTPEPTETVETRPKEYTIPESELLACPQEKVNDASYWRQRASIVTGFEKAAKKRFEEQIASLNERISKLQIELTQAQSTKPEAPVEVDLAAYFTPAEIEDLGEENAKRIARTATVAAKRIAAEEVKKAIEPIQQRAEKSKEETHESKMRAFEDELTGIVPAYKVIDADPRWLHWLEQEDENGLIRGEMLTAMVKRYNAKGVGRMFNAFLQASGQVTIPKAPPIIPAGNAAGVGANEVDQAQTYRKPTPAEIREFYKRASLGKVSEDERKQFEARLRAAQ